MAKEIRSLDALPPENVKLYVKFMVPLLIVDSATYPQKLAELQKLMIRVNLPDSLQEEILESTFNQSLEPLDFIYECIASFKHLKFENEDEKKAYQFSIIKDMVNIAIADEFISDEEQTIIDEVARAFFGEKKDEIINIAKKSVELDKAFIKGEIEISEFEKGMKNFASLLGGVGVPVAAVYFAGSVVGLSAAGITSGLAALGFGGILGLSSMVTGIGTVIAIGVATYSLVRWLLGSNEREAQKKRESLIQEALKINNKSIEKLSNLYQELSKKLAELIESNEVSKKEIELLRRKIDTYKKAFEYLNQTNEYFKQRNVKGVK